MMLSNEMYNNGKCKFHAQCALNKYLLIVILIFY